MVENEKGSVLKTIGIVVCIFIAILFGILIGSSNNENNDTNHMEEYNVFNQIEENLNIGLENNVVVENEADKNNQNEIKVHYEDDKSFETDLNNGVDVKGKIVKFVVIKYAPDSLLGYNSHAGEHLNFISKNDLKLKSNDIVVAKVISTSKFLGSWMIEFEEIEIIRNEVENADKVENTEEVETTEKNENTEKNETTEKVEKIEKIKPPMSSASAWKSDYREVEKKFKDAGFTNVSIKKIEDAKPDGIWVKAGQVKDVYIGGDSSFYSDDEFDKKAEVVIEYHTYPSVKYTKVSAKTLINDLEKNAATAKEKYLDEYLEISGVVRNIDADLDYITISSNSTEWETIQCYINNADTEKKVKKISKGDKIVVRGQVSRVGEILGYSLYITEIVK